MHVCLVGGGFGRSEEYQAKHPLAPEIVLAEGLRRRGVEVETWAHPAFRPDPGRWDVVHVHHLAEGAVRAAGAGDGTPLVFTSHDPTITCGVERSRIRLTAFAYVCGRAAALVALSQAEARFLDGRHGLGGKTTVIPNGTLPEAFQLRERAPGDGRRTLLYVGQLIPMKGVDVLLRALARMPGPERPRLRLAYHDAALEPDLQALARELGLHGSVEFCGDLNPEALAEAYAGADLLVHPSYAEALPSVVTEAMLCGLPVVASAVGGIPEQLGTLGHLVPPGSVEALAAAITAALERLPLDAARREALRERARTWSRVDDMVGGHLKLYAQLIRDSSAGRPRARNVVDRLAGSAMDLYRLTHPIPQEGVSP
ncbi:MAG TPA: glycosyltransferase family 4 protein [Myxococcaceae bacterium]|nr:glycosyltransferase family 4 protein [Myxococcaceae bacterium]